MAHVCNHESIKRNMSKQRENTNQSPSQVIYLVVFVDIMIL